MPSYVTPETRVREANWVPKLPVTLDQVTPAVTEAVGDSTQTVKSAAAGTSSGAPGAHWSDAALAAGVATVSMTAAESEASILYSGDRVVPSENRIRDDSEAPRYRGSTRGAGRSSSELLVNERTAVERAYTVAWTTPWAKAMDPVADTNPPDPSTVTRVAEIEPLGTESSPTTESESANPLAPSEYTLVMIEAESIKPRDTRQLESQHVGVPSAVPGYDVGATPLNEVGVVVS